MLGISHCLLVNLYLLLKMHFPINCNECGKIKFFNTCRMKCRNLAFQRSGWKWLMVTFFLQVSWEKSYLKSSTLRMYETDMAKVFNINVTNTIDGGASSCLPCPQVSVLAADLNYKLMR